MLKRYMADGNVRAVWSDGEASFFRGQLNAVPHRASHIEVVESGPRQGCFHVSFAPLHAATQLPWAACCLRETFDNYEDARRAEIVWLQANYVLGGI